MFSYSTETIINDPSFIEVKKVNGQFAGLYIKGVNLFQKQYICNVTKRPYVAEQNEVAEIDFSQWADFANVPDNVAIRLKVVTKQVGLVSSIYKDAQLVNKKPFFYEVVKESGNTTADIADKFAKVIAKDMQKTDFNFFKASVNGSKLVLTADDCYTRFLTDNSDEDTRVDYIDEIPLSSASTSSLAPSYTGFEDYKPSGLKLKVTTKGTEGAGTVKRLIKNLRIPTDARTNPFAPDFGGLPVPGGQYDQYVIEYVTERRFIGHQVMGAIDKSVTTHVLFLNSAIPCGENNNVSAVFEAACEEGGIQITTIATGNPATTFVAGSTQPKDVVALKSDVAAVEGAIPTTATATTTIDLSDVTDSQDGALKGDATATTTVTLG